jgi:preprotein translocase subunit YajC
MNLLSILLQAAQPKTGGNWEFMIFIVLMIAVIYFFTIRPQQKRQKELQKAREAMKVGDKVILANGVHGRIKEIKEKEFIVEVAENVKVKVDKNYVYKTAEEAQAEPQSSK